MKLCTGLAKGVHLVRRLNWMTKVSTCVYSLCGIVVLKPDVMVPVQMTLTSFACIICT